MRTRPAVVVAVVLKAVLAGLLLFALANLEWERFADKAFTARALLYPVLVAIVPVWWLLRGRPRFPADVDILVTTPFVVDTLGNAVDAYDRLPWFDDACHLVNWALLTAAVGCALLRDDRQLPPWVVAALCVGFGAASAVLWEIGEYGAFILDTPESVTAYRDTLGDLALGLSGSALAGLWVARRRVARDA